MKLKGILFLIYGFLFFLPRLSAQTTSPMINRVFQDLVISYGSSKVAPKVVLKSGTPTPASYISNPLPQIIIDQKLNSLFKQMGNDSLNAIAIILSHELAHYYSDHTFCSDFSFAVRNTSLSEKMKASRKAERLINETQADNNGIFYAKIAGYDPFTIYNELIDKIYSTYRLPEQMEGYPSKSERKIINKQAQQKVGSLYLVFQRGLAELKTGKYENAIGSFEQVNRYFPSREIYNNSGIAKTLKALSLKPLEANEFIYPIELDPDSRLNATRTRGLIEEQQLLEMETLLKSAQRDFEKAISLDPLYFKAYVNLACVYDLMGNPMAAIGKIKELPKHEQENKLALKVLLIAYYHADMLESAKQIMGQLN